MDDISLGKILLRKDDTPPTNTTTITAVALEDSDEGRVTVDIGGEAVEIDTVGAVYEGDEVLINVSNYSPVGSGVVGWGDKVNDKTQYITFVSTGADAGLHIHEDASDYNTDGDLHLTSGGLEIRDSGTVLADFTATDIHLGKNSQNSSIEMCGDTGEINVKIKGGKTYFNVESQYVMLSAPGDSLSTGNGIELDVGVAGHTYVALSGYHHIVPGMGMPIPTILASTDRFMIACSYGLYVNNDPGTSGQVLTSQGAGSPPIWSTVQGGGAVTTWYGTSSTAAGTQTKDVTCADFVLEKGAIVTVYFSNANTYGALKLNVNSTGAIAVYHRGTVTSSSNVVSWNKKDYCTFQYDGTYWVFVASSGSRVISSKDRLTSANVGTNGTGGLNHIICKATTMTTGTPASDGHIIDLDWDANYSQHAQLFLPCVDNQFPQWRMQVNNAWTEWDTFYTAANPPSGCSLAWNQVAQTTNNTAAALDLTGYSEVLIVADALRNSAHHFFSVNVPIQAISSTAAEYKLGGYVGANASTSGGAWCSMNLTSFNGVQLFINNTSFLSSTTWTVYAR